MRRTQSNLIFAIIAILATIDISCASEKQCDCKSQQCVLMGGINLASQTISGVLTTDQNGSFFLRLDEKICAVGTGKPEDFHDSVDIPDQVVVHVAPDVKTTMEDFSRAVGQRVILHGYPFAASNAHHLTPVLWDTKRIEVF